MIRAVIKLALVLLLVHAGVKCVPVYWKYVELSDQITETAKFAGKKTEAQIIERIETIARNMDVTFDDLTVKKQGELTQVSARYQARFEWFPNRFKPHEFIIDVEGAPPRYGDLLP
ncbi:MAG: DUF4845 domain-containing protein [Acidobacteria bacterium]|jgi:hypothetical protein|nr:DUF4845 domain-containing protein [Acidobacteriota bacterium]